jgi:hypothetical protein
VAEQNLSYTPPEALKYVGRAESSTMSSSRPESIAESLRSNIKWLRRDGYTTNTKSRDAVRDAQLLQPAETGIAGSSSPQRPLEIPIAGEVYKLCEACDGYFPRVRGHSCNVPRDGPALSTTAREPSAPASQGPVGKLIAQKLKNKEDARYKAIVDELYLYVEPFLSDWTNDKAHSSTATIIWTGTGKHPYRITPPSRKVKVVTLDQADLQYERIEKALQGRISEYLGFKPKETSNELMWETFSSFGERYVGFDLTLKST